MGVTSMFCRICGTKLPNDAIFCNTCGNRVQTSPAEQQRFEGNIPPLPENSTPPLPIMGDYQPTLPAYPAPPTRPLTSAPMTRPLTPAPPTAPLWSSGFPPGSSVTPPPDAYSAYAPNMAAPPPLPAQVSLATQPVAPPPLNALQRFLVRTFQPAMASNALFGVLVGSIIAVVFGGLCSWLLISVAHAIVPHGVTYFSNSSEDSIDVALGMYPLHSALRDSLQFFLLMHGVAQHVQYVTASQSYVSNSSISAPLSGLLIIPALLLTLGGYIAACTDFQNRVQSSLLRGAAIAIPYTLLLFLVMTQVNGLIPLAAGSSSTDTTLLSMDGASLAVFGLLWGVLFGALGASLKLARGQWRHMLREYLRFTRHPQIAGMIVGGLCAVGIGFFLSLLFIFGFLAFSSYSSSILSAKLCYPGSWQYLLAWGMTQGSLHAANLFLFSFGTPITISNPVQQGYSCFYTNAPHTVLTLRDGSLHLQSWVFAVLLLPLISLFLGGRASVAVSRVRGVGPAAIQGALIAVPFTVLMMLLSLISTITYTYSSSSASSSVSAAASIQSAGAGAIDVILWALLGGAALGMLGGIYEESGFKIGVSKFFFTIGKALSLPATPVYLLLDSLSGRSVSSPRTNARSLLYAAFTLALLLAVVALVLGGSLITLDQTITFQDNQRIRDSISVLLIILPGLLLFSACVSALATDPMMDNQAVAVNRQFAY